MAEVSTNEIRDPERFQTDQTFLAAARDGVLKQLSAHLEHFVHSYPSACSVDDNYLPMPNATRELGSDWTAGFWTGMLWLAYELSGNELFRAVAEAQYDDYAERLETYTHLNHHDIGFLYIPSIVAQYKLTGAVKAKALALEAAELLAKRYSPVAGIIQVRDRNEQGNFIIDCALNVPLLYWASFETGDRSFYLKALNHMYRVAKHMVRDDGSTYQYYKIDEVTGEPIRGWKGQGQADESCWARGQAWAMYGLAVSYRYTKEPMFLEQARKVSNYFLNNLPEDLVCCWDLDFTDDATQRDTSAAAIAASALLELSSLIEDGEDYRQAATTILANLHKHYTADHDSSNGILLHGVYVKDRGEGGLGDDECCIWGDYFYLEALTRLSIEWQTYW